MQTVYVIKTNNREAGVKKAFELLGVPSLKDKKVVVKPNFNTADPAPGSTHNDTLATIITELQKREPASVTVGERSGPPKTQDVAEEKGILQLASKLGFKFVNFEEISEQDWVPHNFPGCHWENGFAVPKLILDADYIVSTCCLKTHAYGGVFTMSLKLSVGLTPKKLMRQLHSSPHMRKMIAEINHAYQPDIIIMDGVEAFVDGGPARGERVEADVIIAGQNRVAVDAVGVAMLKMLGSNQKIMDTKVFDQEQITRAVELGLGVKSFHEIKLVSPDKASQEVISQLQQVIAREV